VLTTYKKVIEALILLISNLTFVARPDSFDDVEVLAVDVDGVVDKVGVFLNDISNLLDLGELVAAVLEVKGDASASFEPRVAGFADFISSASV